MISTNALARKNFLSSIAIKCKKIISYLIIFTQIYSPAAYGGKLYFEINEERSDKVTRRINLKIWEEVENQNKTQNVRIPNGRLLTFVI